MEFNIEINTQEHFARIMVTGHISVQGIAETLAAVLTDKQWHPAMDLLADYSKSSTIDLNTEKVSQISDMVKSYKELIGTGKLAIVMDSELDFGYARMFQLLTEDYIDKEVYIFRNSEEAGDWLSDSNSIKL